MHPVKMICIAFYLGGSHCKSFLVETEDTNVNINNMKDSQEASMTSEDGKIWIIALRFKYLCVEVDIKG